MVVGADTDGPGFHVMSGNGGVTDSTSLVRRVKNSWFDDGLVREVAVSVAGAVVAAWVLRRR
jgi:hypothetical protein